MKTVSIFSLILIVLLGSCKEEESFFKTPAGTWTYTTPDSKLSISFDLMKVESKTTNWYVTNPVMRVDGVSIDIISMQAEELNPPRLKAIRMSAEVNGAHYSINLVNCVVNADNTEINVPNAAYTWPYDKTNHLQDLVIVRTRVDLGKK